MDINKSTTNKRARYIDYDYEATFQQSVEGWDERMIESLLLDKKKKAIYATKEIRSGRQLEIEIYPEFERGTRSRIPRRTKKTKESQKNLNEKNSRKECERRINANFTDGDVWGTFTYNEAEKPKNWEEAQKNMQSFVRRLNRWRKKHGLGNARYVYVTEQSDKGRWHHHFVADGETPLDIIENLWKKGNRNELRRTEEDENGLSGMAHYMTKESKGKKRWTCSKGLKRPEVKVTHYKFAGPDVYRAVKSKAAFETKCANLFGKDGYEWTEGKMYSNGVNGYFYLYARMRMPKEKTIKRRRD